MIEVEGLRSDRGQLRALVFRGDDGFPGERGSAVYSTQVSIEDGTARVQVPDLAPGTYAVTVFHDENDNAALDMNLLGWPQEGVGTSRGAHRRLGPPRYEDARFELIDSTRTEHVEVLYPPL